MTMSVKTMDSHNRWRSVMVSFRMSPEEADELNKLAKLSGQTKRGYIADRCLQRDIVVKGNPRVFKALKDQMTDIIRRLEELPDEKKTAEPEFWEVIQMVAELMIGLSKPMEMNKNRK